MGAISEVRIPFGNRDLHAALALPVVVAAGRVRSAAGVAAASDVPSRRLPAVIVIHELFGLNDDIRAIASRFADEGYVAVAPDLLGDLGPQPVCIVRFARGLNRVGVGRPYRQLDAIRDWLGALPEVDRGRIGVAGFCIGGGLALLYAATADDIAVVAPFYAPVPADAEERLARVCPVVASYGRRDRVFGSMAARLEAALTAAGIDHDVKSYPAAGHSFMNRHARLTTWLGARSPMRAAYEPEAAEDAWRRVVAFFGRYLAPPESPPA
jgi:carboxymethylenebutenolidase